MTQSPQDSMISPTLLYAINEAVWKSTSLKNGIADLVRLIRTSFVFDNLAVYLIDPLTLNLEIAYAKATGRGKSAGADVAWGEVIANRIVDEKIPLLQEQDDKTQTDRLQNPYLLGLPLNFENETLGAIIFIRFGGPHFNEKEKEFAQYLSSLISQKTLFEKVQQERKNLEHQYSTFQVQEDFIATVAHDLRNPLGFIKGYATTLLREDIQWDKKTQKEFLTIIDQETDHLQALIGNLLDSAKLQSGQIVMDLQAVRLDALVNDLLTRTRLHNANLEIIPDVQSPIKTIQADPRRISQVFENLISNAVKYAPGSPVYITIGESPDGINIDFRDEGSGIPEKYLESVFNRFFRVPDTSLTVYGSGLGLFICKQIVEMHHGKIDIDSKVGQGTRFNIFLPDQP